MVVVESEWLRLGRETAASREEVIYQRRDLPADGELYESLRY